MDPKSKVVLFGLVMFGLDLVRKTKQIKYNRAKGDLATSANLRRWPASRR